MKKLYVASGSESAGHEMPGCRIRPSRIQTAINSIQKSAHRGRPTHFVPHTGHDGLRVDLELPEGHIVSAKAQQSSGQKSFESQDQLHRFYRLNARDHSRHWSQYARRVRRRFGLVTGKHALQAGSFPGNKDGCHAVELMHAAIDIRNPHFDRRGIQDSSALHVVHGIHDDRAVSDKLFTVLLGDFRLDRLDRGVRIETSQACAIPMPFSIRLYHRSSE